MRKMPKDVRALLVGFSAEFAGDVSALVSYKKMRVCR